MRYIRACDFDFYDLKDVLTDPFLWDDIEKYEKIGFKKSTDYHGMTKNFVPFEWELLHVEHNRIPRIICSFFVAREESGAFTLKFQSDFFHLVQPEIDKEGGVSTRIMWQLRLMVIDYLFDLRQQESKKGGNKAGKSTNIYLIHDTESNKLKIGQTVNPSNRLSQLQTANPSELKMLFCIKNQSIEIEKELHALYKEYNVRREWFEYKEEIVNHFKKMQDEYNQKAK